MHKSKKGITEILLNKRFGDIDDISITDQYKEGYEADRKGISRFDCPYTDIMLLSLWQWGWHESRLDMIRSQRDSETDMKRKIVQLIRGVK